MLGSGLLVLQLLGLELLLLGRELLDQVRVLGRRVVGRVLVVGLVRHRSLVAPWTRTRTEHNPRTGANPHFRAYVSNAPPLLPFFSFSLLPPTAPSTSYDVSLPLSLCLPKKMAEVESIQHELPPSGAAPLASVAIDLLAGTVSGWAQVFTGQPVRSSSCPFPASNAAYRALLPSPHHFRQFRPAPAVRHREGPAPVLGRVQGDPGLCDAYLARGGPDGVLQGDGHAARGDWRVCLAAVCWAPGGKEGIHVSPF